MAVSDPASNPELVADCNVLLEARDILAGDASLNWSETIPVGSWQGVAVGGYPRRIVKLDLREIELAGVIPPGLSMLTELHTLDISHGRLTGSIPPELGNLTKVRYLRLQVNMLTGVIPVELGMLTSVVILDLGNNQLTGEIPRELADLPNLRRLYLAINYLTGEIPIELTQLSTLQTFHVIHNRLSGCVPDSMRDLDTEIMPLRFCGDLLQIWTHRPTFEGGVDLGVTYIERLPRFQRYKIAYFGHGDCPYPHDRFEGATVCPDQAGIKRWPDPGETVELIAHVWNFGDTASGLLTLSGSETTAR